MLLYFRREERTYGLFERKSGRARVYSCHTARKQTRASAPVEDLDALRRAYPNYYVDTSGFMYAVQEEIGEVVSTQRNKEEEPEEQEEQPGLFDNQ